MYYCPHLPAGKLTASSNPTERARILASQLSLLQTRLSELASTPVPHDKTSTLPAVAPWATSRSAFINWAAEKKAVPNAAGSRGQVGGPGQLPEDVVVEKFQEEAARTGAAEDAKVSSRLALHVKGAGSACCGDGSFTGTCPFRARRA